MSQISLLPGLTDAPESFTARRILAAFEVARGDWLQRIRRAALELYHVLCRPISADDLRALMARHPHLEPPGDNRNVMGSVFRDGWEQVGWIRSRTPGSHGNLIALWRPAA